MFIFLWHSLYPEFRVQDYSDSFIKGETHTSSNVAISSFLKSTKKKSASYDTIFKANDRLSATHHIKSRVLPNFFYHFLALALILILFSF